MIMALVLRREDDFSGVNFVTPPEFSQQLGFLKHPEGHRISPHTHNRVKREVINTQEVLIIREGKVKVFLYTEERRFLRHLILETGDIILLAAGGHGLEILENAEIVEVKQGPYLDELRDKARFEWPEGE